MLPDGRDVRLNVRVEPWRRADYQRFVKAHPEKYRDVTDFVIKACDAEMGLDTEKKRFLTFLEKALTENPRIIDLIREMNKQNHDNP